VILLHGRGVHPASSFLDALRADLADAGWHTLSLQMPILSPDVNLAEYARTFDEAFARIEAGLAYLTGRGVKRVVLLGHSTGALTALAYAAEHPGRVAGVVAIGPSTEPLGGTRMQPALLLREIRNLPVLDLYGSQDLPVVLDYNRARAEAARARLATRVTASFASKVPITSSPIGTTNSSGN
jgi:pimeloyl-ACP methyl ester carboxylesterase